MTSVEHEVLLVEEYERWLEWQNLPHESADELILWYDLSPYQREYVTSFIKRWMNNDIRSSHE